MSYGQRYNTLLFPKKNRSICLGDILIMFTSLLMNLFMIFGAQTFLSEKSEFPLAHAH